MHNISSSINENLHFNIRQYTKAFRRHHSETKINFETKSNCQYNFSSIICPKVTTYFSTRCWTIPPPSTKRTITSHIKSLNIKRPQHMSNEIQVLACNKHTSVAGLNRLMRSVTLSLLIIWFLDAILIHV
jgi:hypothetical protein